MPSPLFRTVWPVALLCLLSSASAATFHLDAQSGDDSRDGAAPTTAWKSLERANRHTFKPGDVLLLRRGSVFKGALRLSVQATAAAPFRVGHYGREDEGDLPLIDAAGWLAGVTLDQCRNVVVENLAIVSDGGAVREPAAAKLRHGVLVTARAPGAWGGIRVRGLRIGRIFATEASPDEGRNPTTSKGMGVSVLVEHPEARLSDVSIEGCTIAHIGRTGISIRGRRQGERYSLEDVRVLDNRLEDIGGPGMNPSTMRRLLVRGNTVDRSGSFSDPRMHGRGSGIWPWTCEDVLIERNRFMHARGKGDSCGIHIDFNCRDVVVQYNLSIDNEGGFVEILGNNHNCAYRYNISVNDGARVRKKDGAKQEGKILWTSGFVGKGPKKGPYNSYIYNNTVYVAPGGRSCFSFGSTTEGLLIANNIFHLQGESLNVSGDQEGRVETSTFEIPRAVMENNLFLSAASVPPGLPVKDLQGMTGDVGFRSPGGLNAEDYTPRSTELVRNRGRAITRLPGDDIGLRIGLEVKTDILGRPLRGRPDLGAIELD